MEETDEMGDCRDKVEAYPALIHPLPEQVATSVRNAWENKAMQR